MILDNLITKEELRKVLQERYDKLVLLHKTATNPDKTTLTEVHFHGMLVSCLRIAEKFDIELKKYENL